MVDIDAEEAICDERWVKDSGKFLGTQSGELAVLAEVSDLFLSWTSLSFSAAGMPISSSLPSSCPLVPEFVQKVDHKVCICTQFQPEPIASL